MQASSKGKYFNRDIGGRFPYTITFSKQPLVTQRARVNMARSCLKSLIKWHWAKAALQYFRFDLPVNHSK